MSAVPQPESFPLARYDAMCSAIAECLEVDEVKDIHDKARALEIYAKQAQNVDAERKACEVRLRAERRAGQLLASLAKATPHGRAQAGGLAKAALSNGGTKHEAPAPTAYAKALADNNIPRQTAHRYEQLAAVPAPEFEAALAAPEKPTTNAILRAANGDERMDADSLWLWGRLRDVERNGLMQRNPADVFGGMTESMQADVQRLLPGLAQWLATLSEVIHGEEKAAQRAH